MAGLIPADFGVLTPGEGGITATGTTQATAYVVSKKANIFTTVASGSGSVLPSSYASGVEIEFFNRGANALKIYPPLGDEIESYGVNVAFSLEAGGNCYMLSFDPPLAAHPRKWWLTWITTASLPYLPLAGGTVTGLTTFSFAGTGLAVTNNATIGGTLGVSGAGTFSGAGTGLAVTNNQTIGGTLVVTGAATASTSITSPRHLVTGGAITVSGDGLAARRFLLSNSLTGTSSSNTNWVNLFNVDNDNVATPSVANGKMILLGLRHHFGGAAVVGGRHALDIDFSLNATTSNSTGVGASYTAARVTAKATANDGGTNITRGLSRGDLYGGNFVASSYNGATNFHSVIGMEVNTWTQTGSSMVDRIGHQIVDVAGSTVGGAATVGDDQAISMNNQYDQGSGIGWLEGIAFGRRGGYFPMRTTGTMISANANVGGSGMTTLNGIDWTAVTFTGHSLKMPLFTVDGVGTVVVGGFVDQSIANALTATGATRADALALTKQINRITTAAAGTGVILPTVATSGIGAELIIFNSGANLIKVYGAGSDTIDGVAAATGVNLTNALRCKYVAVAAATWISAQMGVVSA